MEGSKPTCVIVMIKFLFTLAVIQQCVSFELVDFYLYRRAGEVQLTSGKLPDDYDRNKTTYVLLHGTGGSKDGVCVQALIEALLETGDRNVLTPSYQYAGSTYLLLYRSVTQRIARFLLENEVDPMKTEVIGMSLGAQISGGLHSYGVKPYRITGLDPAGPFFSWIIPEFLKLCPDSAHYVQAVHTNIGRYGSTTLDGHLDLYINGGYNYPCCGNDDFCKHKGACDWTASTIRNGPVEANVCPTQAAAFSGGCAPGKSVFAGFGAAPVEERTVAHLTLPEDAC